MSRLMLCAPLWLFLSLLSFGSKLDSPAAPVEHALRRLNHTDHLTSLTPFEKQKVSNQDLWNCLCKGAQLEFFIRRGIYEANVPNAPKQEPGLGNPNTPSAFQDPKSGLAKYTKYGPTLDYYKGELDQLSEALSALKVPDDRTYFEWFLSYKYKPKELLQYDLLISPSQGALSSTYSESLPRGDKVPNDIPNRWSDVVFLAWLSLCQQATPPVDGGSLRYIFRQSIQNPITQAVIDQYAPNAPTWPGISFKIGTMQAQALLGTPNGVGIAWMLMQHQKTFGNKKVQNIVVFANREKGTGNTLLFELDEEEDPGDPMAIDWEWVAPDSDRMQLDPRAAAGGRERGMKKGSGEYRERVRQKNG